MACDSNAPMIMGNRSLETTSSITNTKLPGEDSLEDNAITCSSFFCIVIGDVCRNFEQKLQCFCFSIVI
jgi:cytochrome c oxidase assembly protein Cox11